jgi:hypothetical protein
LPLDVASLLFSFTVGAIAPLGDGPLLVNAMSTPIAASFQPARRAVDNWRIEAARKLAVEPAVIASLLGGADPKSLPRCVKLNNYWCIKGAGWNGMLTADAEGHAAFSTAVEGAAVAALLLRRYYLEFSRRSATDIVSRWAPAQCGMAPVARSSPAAGRRPGIAQTRPALGPDPKPRVDALATHGIGATLRARYLAARRGGRRVAGRGGIRRSVVPDRAASLIRAPTISSGYGEPTLAMPTLKLASLSMPPLPGASFAPMMSCSFDGQRIRNYAMKAIEGVATSPSDDLKLFDPDGTPLPALQRVMENMSGVEIGPYKASSELVRAGIEQATAAMRAAREAANAPAASSDNP